MQRNVTSWWPLWKKFPVKISNTTRKKPEPFRMKITTLFALFAASAIAHADDSIFATASEWETVSEGHNFAEGIAATQDGTVYITDVPDNELIRLNPDGTETVIDKNTDRANGLAFGPDGRLYSVCMGKPQALAWDLKTGEREEIKLPSPGNDLAITTDGRLFYTWGKSNAVYEVDLDTRRAVKVADLENPNGIALSSDGKQLIVGKFFTDTVVAFPVLPERDLGDSKVAYKLKTPENGRGFPDGMTPLPDGRLLASTALGLQILSRDGTPELIANPTDQRANYVRFVSDADGKKWIYTAYVKSILRRAAFTKP
jgi:gluconolactonase